MADNIGTAYVQIEPSFEGVTPKIEQHFGGEGEKAGKSFGGGFGSVVGVVVVGFAGLTQPQSNSITIRMQKIRFISSFAFFVLSCRIISRRGEKSKEGLHLPDAGV